MSDSEKEADSQVKRGTEGEQKLRIKTQEQRCRDEKSDREEGRGRHR